MTLESPFRSTQHVYFDDLDALNILHNVRFLLFMEQAGVLDGATRERVIDKVMALDAVGIELEQLKWVVLMVLFNQPGRESLSSWMEDLLIDHHAGMLH